MSYIFVMRLEFSKAILGAADVLKASKKCDIYILTV
jgi:hypothetical protein